MKPVSQRLAFTALMTVLATLFGAGFGLVDLRHHPDQFTDVIKISALLFVAALGVSFVIWTLTHLRRDSVMRGGLAGCLTGLLIVPIPYFTSSLKAQAYHLYSEEGTGLILSVLKALPLSVRHGLDTYLLISKASLAAVIGSTVLGVIVAKYVLPPSGD